MGSVRGASCSLAGTASRGLALVAQGPGQRPRGTHPARPRPGAATGARARPNVENSDCSGALARLDRLHNPRLQTRRCRPDVPASCRGSPGSRPAPSGAIGSICVPPTAASRSTAGRPALVRRVIFGEHFQCDLPEPAESVACDGGAQKVPGIISGDEPPRDPTRISGESGALSHRSAISAVSLIRTSREPGHCRAIGFGVVVPASARSIGTSDRASGGRLHSG